ncbi:MAG TPA: Arc family DNA-binding protein [Stellaceae bacterium]|nr:Arc family DNA-binding protein [Stellaceae bacterium]
MATLTIRNVDPELREKLRVQAALHGRSMEAELRVLLHEALRDVPHSRALNLAEAIHRRFLALGGVDDLEPHPPVPVGSPPEVER